MELRRWKRSATVLLYSLGISFIFQMINLFHQSTIIYYANYNIEKKNLIKKRLKKENRRKHKKKRKKI